MTFDANNIESFNELKETWLPEVLRYADQSNPPRLILVGTKTDIKQTENAVPLDDIVAFANEHSGMFCCMVSSKNQDNIGSVVEQLEFNAMEHYRVTQDSMQFKTWHARQRLHPSRPSRPQPSPSFSNKALLAMMATGAGAIAIGYALFQYQAEIALLVGVHMPPALLVGLAIIAAVAAAYGAYYCFFGNKRPGQERLVRHEQLRISSRTSDDYGAAWDTSEDGGFSSDGALLSLRSPYSLEHSSDDELEEKSNDSYVSFGCV